MLFCVYTDILIVRLEGNTLEEVGKLREAACDVTSVFDDTVARLQVPVASIMSNYPRLKKCKEKKGRTDKGHNI